MRRLLPFIALFVLYACSKSDQDALSLRKRTEKLSPFTKEVLKLRSFEQLRMGQSMLSSSERDSLWHYKYEVILANDGDSFTVDQSNIVNSLVDFLDYHGMDALIADSSLGQTFVDQNLSSWSQHFDKLQLYLLIECPYVTDSFSILRLGRPGYEIFPIGDNENLTSNCTCLYDIGCPGGQNMCEKKDVKCKKVAECGLFGTSNCKGRCEGLQPDF